MKITLITTLPPQAGAMAGAPLTVSLFGDASERHVASNHLYWVGKYSAVLEAVTSKGAAAAVRMWWVPNGAENNFNHEMIHTTRLMGQDVEATGLVLPEMAPQEVVGERNFGNLLMSVVSVQGEENITVKVTISLSEVTGHYPRPGFRRSIEPIEPRFQRLGPGAEMKTVETVPKKK